MDTLFAEPILRDTLFAYLTWKDLLALLEVNKTICMLSCTMTVALRERCHRFIQSRIIMEEYYRKRFHNTRPDPILPRMLDHIRGAVSFNYAALFRFHARQWATV